MTADHLLIKAATRKPAHRRPFWIVDQSLIFREFIDLFEHEGNFLSLMSNPLKATEISLIPFYELKVDAIELFSSPYLPANFMNLDCKFERNQKRLLKPVRNSAQAKNLVFPQIEKDLKFVLDTLRNLHGQSFDAPIIAGCAGAMSLSAFVIDGTINHEMYFSRAILYAHEEAFTRILRKINEFLIEFALAQIEAGAEVICVHDPFAKLLSYENFQRLYLPLLKNFVSAVQTDEIPVIYNADGIYPFIDMLIEVGFDAVSIDNMHSAKAALEKVDNKISLQGNFDPVLLLGQPDKMETQITSHLQELGRNHGFIGTFCGEIPKFVSLDNLKFFIRKYQELSSGYATSK